MKFGDLMAFYECTFIARQDIPAQDVHKLADRFMETLSGLGAKIIKKEYWGLRSLAYVIKKNKKGHYVMLGVQAAAEAVKEFERTCKINEDILKYLVVRVDKIDEAPSAMMQAPAKATPGEGAKDNLI